MKFTNYGDIPEDVLSGLIALFSKNFRMPTRGGAVEDINFAAGQCSVVQELIDERDKRTKRAEAESRARMPGDLNA